MDMFLRGRRIHIAGSASRETDPNLVTYAHHVIRSFVRAALMQGASLVVQIGGEPRHAAAENSSPSIVFDWTIIEEAHACLAEGIASPLIEGEPLIFAATSEKALASVPAERKLLWDSLLQTGAVRMEVIRPGSRSATVMRELQAREGNVLVTLGGGAGVEHLAEVYVRRQRPVVPLDTKLGASREDGTLGGAGIARLALTDPLRFFHLRQTGTETARLAALSTHAGRTHPVEVAERLVAFIRDLAPPKVFFIRLLNQTHPDFHAVESFFRDVVEPVVAEAGYQRREVGTDEALRAFINVEIFEELYHSPLVVADLTGERPNCYIELGYALRGTGKVLVTAKQGTSIPFDANTIPLLFWQQDLQHTDQRVLFQDYWRKNINRPSLVQPKVPF